MKRLYLALPALATFALAQEPAKPTRPAQPLRPAPAAAKAPDQAQLKKQRDEKLAKEFLKLADWQTDFAKARAQAKQDDKLILTYFSRSYAA